MLISVSHEWASAHENKWRAVSGTNACLKKVYEMPADVTVPLPF